MQPPARCVAQLSIRASVLSRINRLISARELGCRRGDEGIDLLAPRREGCDEPETRSIGAAPAVEFAALVLERAYGALRQLDKNLVRLDRVAEPRAAEPHQPGAKPRRHAVRVPRIGEPQP